MKRRSMLLAALLLLLLGRTQAAQAAQPNLVVNSDFSQLSNGRPANWETSGDPKHVDQTLSAGRDADGASYGELSCTRLEHVTGWSHAMVLQFGQVRLTQGHTYEFSCRLRAENLAGRTVNVAIQETKPWGPAGLEAAFPVGPQWRTYRRMFCAAQDVGPTGRLQFHYLETGALYLTDVRITEIALGNIEYTDVIEPGEGANLVPNGSFELGVWGWGSIGQGAGWGDLPGLHGQIETGAAPHGKSFLRIPLGGANTPQLFFDYFEPFARREIKPLAGNRGWIRVEKGTAYTLSCRMRASADGVPAVLGARGREPEGPWRDYRLAVKLTREWERYSHTFRPTQRFVYVFFGPDLDQEQQVDVDVDAVQLQKAEQPTEFAPRDAMEFAVFPADRTGIFARPAAAGLILSLADSQSAAVAADVSFDVRDYQDQPVPLPPLTIQAAAGSAASSRLTLPADWQGYYRLRAAATVAGRRLSSETCVAIVPRPRVRDSVCGINHAFTSAEMIRAAGKAGITWYRDWSLKWQHLEPVKGELNWSVADRQIERVLAEGAHVLPLLPPFPSAEWSSEAPAGLAGPKGSYFPVRQSFAPGNPAELAGFIEQTVKRYRDRIGVWEFLNEPIYTHYAMPQDGDNRIGGGRHYTPADYAALLAIASDAMKRGDANCKVIGGIAGGPETLTRDLIQAGALGHVDILNLHIYPGSRRPESYLGPMQGLLALMDAAAGRKPIWMTEFSYYGADRLPRRPFMPRPDSWSENRLLEDERQCADYTLRFFAVMMAHGVEKFFIHSGASSRLNDPNQETALFTYGPSPRKLIPALAVFNDLLGDTPRCAGYRKLGQFAHAVAFESVQQAVVMTWEEEEGAGQVLDVPPLVSCLDTMGLLVSRRPLKLGPSPCYLVARPGEANKLLRAFAETRR